MPGLECLQQSLSDEVRNILFSDIYSSSIHVFVDHIHLSLLETVWIELH